MNILHSVHRRQLEFDFGSEDSNIKRQLCADSPLTRNTAMPMTESAILLSPFASRFMAGFECGFLGYNSHDLLRTTRHLPEDRMAEHYSLAMRHGLLVARDGLPWRHDPRSRFDAAARAGIEVIWDLNHYDPPPDPVQHTRAVVEAADPKRRLWICPVNEPALYPKLAGMSESAAVDMAITMARVARDLHPEVRVLSTDPITGIGERQFAATDALVAAGIVDVVGINYYPHTARTALRKVIRRCWRRYGKPILVSETSWHTGHPVHDRKHPGFDKGAWLRHVCDEVRAAENDGAQVAGICWYPVIDCPPWHRPGSRQRWSHGLIRADLSCDSHLSEAFLQKGCGNTRPAASRSRGPA